MASITFPILASGLTFLDNSFDAQAGGTPWSPADCMEGAGVQVESAGNHGNGIGLQPDGSPFDLSSLGSATGPITSAIVHFAHNGTYSTVGPGADYSIGSNWGGVHTQAEGASWSDSGDGDISSEFIAPFDVQIEDLPAFAWSAVILVGGSIENGVTVGYEITALSITFEYTPTAPVVTDVSPAHGDVTGGNVVTLTGTGFTGTTTASFGDTPTLFSPSSDTTGTCVAPAHARGEVTVTVA